MIATKSNQLVVIADQSKLVPALGSFGILLEVVHFYWPSTARTVANVRRSLDIPMRVFLRKLHGVAVKTDNSNLILDAFPGTGLKSVATVAAALGGIVGHVEHGLLVDMATVAVIAGSNSLNVNESQRIRPWSSGKPFPKENTSARGSFIQVDITCATDCLQLNNTAGLSL